MAGNTAGSSFIGSIRAHAHVLMRVEHLIVGAHSSVALARRIQNIPSITSVTNTHVVGLADVTVGDAAVRVEASSVNSLESRVADVALGC